MCEYQKMQGKVTLLLIAIAAMTCEARYYNYPCDADNTEGGTPSTETGKCPFFAEYLLI